MALVASPVAAGAAPATPPSPAAVDQPAPPADLATCVERYRAKQYRGARDCFAALVAAGDRTAPIRFALGYCHYQLREHGPAERRFREAVALEPKDGDLRFMHGMALAQQKREAEALAELRRALALGLKSEDPAEARRTIRLLERLLAARPRQGWLTRLTARVGYDSRPRLEGAAAQAGSSDGQSTAGSAVVGIEASLGYRILHGRWGSTTLSYAFHQRLVLSDVLSQGTGRAGRFGTPPPELSLQVHRLRGAFRAAGTRVSGGLQVGGEVELAGLRTFGALVAAVPLEADLQVHWHALTRTRLALGGAWQRALDESVGYLGGGGLWVGLSQHLRWRILTAELGWELGSWWLGTASQPVSDCQAGDPCALEVPYSHLANRVRLALGVRPRPWLALAAGAGLAHRRYRPEARYRSSAGQEVSLTRVDLTPQVDVALRFRLAKGLWLELAWRYVYNRSTVNEAEVGIEEGYQRHVAELGLAWSRW